MDPQKQKTTADYYVGQEGEFLLLDSFSNPIELVKGEIVRLMGGQNPGSTYAMILTERGVRPARLT